MSKHILSSSPSICPSSTNNKRSRFSIDGLLGSTATSVTAPACPITSPQTLSSTSRTSSTAPPPSKRQKLTEPSSPSCSDSDTESLIKQENDEAAAAPNAPIGNWPSLGNSPKLAAVQCKLEGKELWAKFFDLSTEMIITKSGRRMFPTVKIRLEGCDPDMLYYVFLDVVPVDDRRYRYVYNKSSWLTAGKAEPSPDTRIYLHPDSPFPGRQLASQVISFEKAKLTNSDVDRIGHLVLNSMHKYQPRVHVVVRDRNHPLQSSRVDLSREDYKSFQFTETQFMAVTAYQNQLITKLKIEKNPFAKGFRDPSGRSTEMELERHLERLPRFPFGGLPNSAAAAAALMFGQFPFPLPPRPPSSGPSNDWLFANLAATAAVLNQHPMAASMNQFQKFNFPPLMPTSPPSNAMPKSPSSQPEPEVASVDEEEDDDESVDVINYNNNQAATASSSSK